MLATPVELEATLAVSCSIGSWMAVMCGIAGSPGMAPSMCCPTAFGIQVKLQVCRRFCYHYLRQIVTWMSQKAPRGPVWSATATASSMILGEVKRIHDLRSIG